MYQKIRTYPLPDAAVVSSTAGLPTSPDNGARALVRAGSTPYSFRHFVYDSAYGHWVSDPFGGIYAYATSAAVTGTDTSYAAVAGHDRIAVYDLKAMYDAGFTLQACWFGILQNLTAGKVATLLANGYSNDGAGTAVDGDLTIDPAKTQTGTNPNFQFMNWTSFSGTPDHAYGLVFPKLKTDAAGTYSLSQSSFGLRWIF